MAESNNQQKDKKSGFVTRLISSIVMVIIASVGLYIGGIIVNLFLAIISLIGVFELLRVFDLHKSSLATITYIASILYYGLIQFNYTEYMLPLFILYILSMLTVYVIRYPKYHYNALANTLFTFFYVPFCLSYIGQMRMKEDGLWFVVLIILCACGNDIFAYLTGILIGKHKIFPILSPKKSTEGFIGGIVGATLCGLIYGIIFSKRQGVEALNYPLMFALICGIGALPAVVGDLAASAIKRNYGIKDYGKLIPGHGGIMDRFDSLIFTAPIVYYLVTIIL